MSNYEKHAVMEFRAAGWTDDNGKFNDPWQEALCIHVLDLLKVFSDEGHSGSTAPYTVNMFKTLSMFEPLVPLTGEDWEWTQIEFGPDMKYQNKRCSHVFKGDDGRAYDSEGRIFYDWYTDEETGEKRKSHYTCSDSRVFIEFPYTPNREYIERISN